MFDANQQMLSNTGNGLQAAGWVAAPFTEGGSLSLAKAGEYFDMAATGVSILHDLLKHDPDLKGALTKTVVTALSYGAGEGVDALAKTGKISTVQKVLVKGQLTVVSKLADKGVDKLTEEREATKIEPAKQDAIPKSRPPMQNLKFKTTN